MARGRSEDFKTPVGRFSYTNGLFVPRAQEEGKKPKYGLTLIFPTTTPKEAFEKAIAQACEAEWPGKWQEMIKAEIIRSPFLRGDGKEARNKTTSELHPGMGADVWFIRASANDDRAPVVRWKSEHTPATAAEVYSGCYGFAVLTAFTWINDKGGKGVSFGLQYVQKTQEGESLGGTGGPVDASKWHEKIEESAPAPETQTGKGAGGLFS